MRIRLVVVGSSWGGMEALGRLLGALDGHNGLTFAVAQHRLPDPNEVLLRFLGRRSTLPVVEVEDKVPVERGRVFLAPADYHLLVEPGHFALSTDAAVRFSRPSIDVLFESAADAYGDAVVAVVLTGANDDGSRGVVAVRDAGGRTYAQDPALAVRPEMPQAAIDSGAVDRVLSIEAIAGELNELGRITAATP